ncbi:hypothetical protein BofuT4_uP103780.1 [Botrytis cinerea T4]|uniref:Uncharacterized protein n=1 Tax=Botryotinia fuckeliana (strain T4) TaxID=999810 RepID=G2YAK9_BOTF4|nr:hypothetical protein BofuT4_uP103780.1 [Botrytis cinerea T4]
MQSAPTTRLLPPLFGSEKTCPFDHNILLVIHQFKKVIEKELDPGKDCRFW